MESNRSALVPLLVIIWDMIACTNKDLLLNLLAVHTLQSSQPEPGLSETITRPLYGILMEAEKQDKKKISILTRPEDGPATMLFFRPDAFRVFWSHGGSLQLKKTNEACRVLWGGATSGLSQLALSLSFYCAQVISGALRIKRFPQARQCPIISVTAQSTGFPTTLRLILPWLDLTPIYKIYSLAIVNFFVGPVFQEYCG
ncbi:hypothetical protein RRG08_024831 [Elysia crispata]|uniref:Uncharacterized protein n=1 Tax=Elysia crispata TaxID=231223 RepID=A0AAE0YIY2_9GAST|nr:hypothetical protein RRG08_024831 [Elysia crispata]